MIYDSYYRENKGKEKLVFLVGWNQTIDKKLMDILAIDYEVLALSFPFQDRYLLDTSAYSIDTYRQLLTRTLISLNYYPTLAVGHSFGGKILSFAPDLFKRLVLIAPSSFKPLLTERIKTRLLIARNKLIKGIFSLLKRKPKKKYLGSVDYQNCFGLRRRTFLNIKDAYPPSDFLKLYADRIEVIAFKDDKTIKLKRVRKRVEGLKKTKLTTLSGGHNEIYYNRTLLLSYLRDEYEN